MRPLWLLPNFSPLGHCVFQNSPFGFFIEVAKFGQTGFEQKKCCFRTFSVFVHKGYFRTKKLLSDIFLFFRTKSCFRTFSFFRTSCFRTFSFFRTKSCFRTFSFFRTKSCFRTFSFFRTRFMFSPEPLSI
jgi:hypothetical protein